MPSTIFENLSALFVKLIFKKTCFKLLYAIQFTNFSLTDNYNYNTLVKHQSVIPILNCLIIFIVKQQSWSVLRPFKAKQLAVKCYPFYEATEWQSNWIIVSAWTLTSTHIKQSVDQMGLDNWTQLTILIEHCKSEQSKQSLIANLGLLQSGWHELCDFDLKNRPKASLRRLKFQTEAQRLLCWKWVAVYLQSDFVCTDLWLYVLSSTDSHF